MKTWSAIFNLIAVIIIAIMIISIHKMEETNRRQFEQIRLSQAVDYATEAAFRSCLSTDSIGTDYYNDGLKEVELNPAMVLPTFLNVLAMSYDLSPSDDNLMKIEQSLATGFLCTVDGYYILEETEMDTNPYDFQIGGEYRLNWGVKRPFIVYTQENGVNRLFAVNLVGEKSIEYVPEGRDTSLIGENISEPIVNWDSYVGTGLTREIVKKSISQLLTDDINYAIHRRNLVGVNERINTFFVPSSESMTAINNVESPALALIFEDSTFLNGYNMDVVSIGGVRVKPKSNVIGFTLDNDDTLYYCFAGQQMGDKFITGDVKPTIHIKRRFNSIHEAAMAGYSPHMMFLQEPYGRTY